MTWVRLEDNFAEHPKIIGICDAAFRLHVMAICYAARHETDGYVSTTIARALIGSRGPKLAVMLVGAGVWEPVENDTYRIHDFLHYNPSRADRVAGRDAARERMRAARERGSSREQTPKFAKPSPNTEPTRTVPKKDDDDVIVSRGAYGDMYWRHFGHEATQAQVQELENAEANHPRECIEWVLSEVGAGDIKWRNMRSVRMKLGDCASLGHGPRAPKYQPKKPTLMASDGREFQSGLADMIVPNTNLRIVEDAG